MKITRQQALEILEVDGPDPSEDEIRAAYRSMALKWHPDKHPEERREEATARFQAIQSANDILTGKEDEAFGMEGDEGFFSEFDILEIFVEIFLRRRRGSGGGGRHRGAGIPSFGDLFEELFGRQYDEEEQFEARKQRHKEYYKAKDEKRLESAWLKEFKKCTGSSTTKTSITIDVDSKNSRLNMFSDKKLPTHGKFFWELEYRPAGGARESSYVYEGMQHTVHELKPGSLYIFRARPCVRESEVSIATGAWTAEAKVWTAGKRC